MKLRLQLAGMLPASEKPAPAEAHGNRTFGTTMEEIMATTSSGKPLLVETSYASLPRQPQSGAQLGTAKPDQTVGESTENTNVAAKEDPTGVSVSVALHPQASNQSEPLQSQSNQPGSPLSQQSSPELAISGSILQKTLIQSAIVQNLNAMTLQGVHQKQSVAGETLPGASSIKVGEPRAKHKTATKADERNHPDDSSLSGAPPVILQQSNMVVPVPALQADGPQSVHLKSNSKAVSEGISSQGVPSRAAFPPMDSNHGALHGTSFTAPESLTVAQPPRIVVSKDGTPPETVSSGANSANQMKMHPALQSSEKANTGVPTLNQAPHLQIAHATDGLEINGRPGDSRVLKEAEKEIGTELKPEIKASVPVSPTPTPSGLQHPAMTTASSPVTRDAEKAMAAHRPEISTAQVLQRMDFAGPSGAVQLRADARRLDVGVSSGVLGWVEVKATTNASGRVDATLHVQNDASAQTLTSQSREISDYAHEHSVQLGQVSVGVGTEDSAQGQSRSADVRDANEARIRGTVAQPLMDAEQTHYAAETVSLISIRA